MRWRTGCHDLASGGREGPLGPFYNPPRPGATTAGGFCACCPVWSVSPVGVIRRFEAVIGELRPPAGRGFRIPSALVDALDREECQRIRADELAHLFKAMGGGEQLVALPACRCR